jgi:hypothetical protein
MQLDFDRLIHTLRGYHAEWLHIGSKSIVMDHIPKSYDDNWTLVIYANGYVLITSENGWSSICSLDDYVSDGSWEQLLNSLKNDLWIDPASVNRFSSLLSYVKAKPCDICGKTTGADVVLIAVEQSQTKIGCRGCLEDHAALLNRESGGSSRSRPPGTLARFFDRLLPGPSMGRRSVLPVRTALRKYPKSVMDAL